MVIRELLRISNPKSLRDAGFLLMQAANITKTELILGELEVSANAQAKYLEFLERYNGGEPIEYIVNSAEFFGHEFYVDRSVLIPRDETELLVEVAIEALNSAKNPTIIDIGTGSGCIAISLALALPTARVVATDISESALEIARRNARDLGVADRIEFICDDITNSTIDEIFNLIISNPPYIALGDEMVEPTVHQFQPHAALYAGENGLEIYRHIVEFAGGQSRPPLLAFEVGYNQANAVAELIQASEKFYDIQKIPDLSGIERIVFAKFR